MSDREDYYHYYIDIDDRTRQWFDEEDGFLEFGLGEQCARGCADGFELTKNRRFLECSGCGALYEIHRADEV